MESEKMSKVQAVLTDLGLDMPEAVDLFFELLINRKGIPFELKKSMNKEKMPRSTAYGILEGKVKMADDFDAPMDKNIHNYEVKWIW
ncbi:MAG: hypothetical protein LBQ97_07250 [Fusobacteriaceae bacterium]|nr:hypothetical protein [Fusobacteriaceae bacterium]